MGGAPSVQAPKPPDPGKEYASALNAYISNAPQLYKEEAEYQPQYNQMQQGIMGSNIAFYSQALENQIPGAQAAMNQAQQSASQAGLANYQQYAGAAGKAAMASSPQLQALNQWGQGQLGATADPTMQGLLQQVQQGTPNQVNNLYNLAQQAGQSMAPINQALQGISSRVGATTQQGMRQLQGLAGQAAADTRSPLWQQTTSAVSGQLGQLDPLTQQLSDTAQQQLALGGQVSAQGLQDAAQAARAAYSSRGMLNSSGSIAAEVLNRDQVQQQRLQQREQFAGAVDPLVQQQIQQRTANALGLSQADLAATQANRTLAGQLYQGAAGLGQSGAQIQGGLQGQIASNLTSAQQQQAALTQAAIGTQQAGTQMAAGLQGSLLDQIYRQQAQGAQTMQNVYGAQQAAIGGILGAPAGGPQLASNIAGGVPSYGTGSPNLFAGSGLLSMVNQNQMAYYNAQAQANQVNAQSKGAASGAMIGAGASIAGSLIGGVAALF
jgi:hypothetical protein